MRSLVPILLLVAPILHAAKLPDWAVPALTPASLAWKHKIDTVALYDETIVTYSTPTLSRTTERAALLYHQLPDGGPRIAILGYDTNSDKIISYAAWLRLPDGKVSSLSRDHFTDRPGAPASHFWNKSKVIHLSAPPKITSGSVLLWEITYETKAHPIRPTGWSAPSSYPLYLGRFSATPPPGTRFVTHILSPSSKPPAIDPATGKITWEIHQHSPAKGSLPDGFRPTPTRIAITCPTPEIPLATWPDLARALDPRYNETSALSPELTAKAASLVAGKKSRWEKIRALTDFIQADVSYLNLDDDADILTGQIPQTATTCLANRFGDCKDKANLLVALLRAIGDQGHVLLVYSGNPTRVPADAPLASFNHANTAIPADADTPAHWPIATHPALGRFVIVDTTSGINPLGTLPIGDQAGLGLLIHPQGDILRLPVDAPAHHGITIDARLTLDAFGHAQLDLDETTDGQAYARLIYMRGQLREKNFQAALEKRLTLLAPRIENLKWRETETAAENRHLLTFTCELRGFARPAGTDILLLNAPTLTAPDALAAWKTDRPGQSWLPLEDHAATYRIELPPGTTLAEPFAPLELTSGETRASLSAEVIDNQLVLKMRYLQPAAFLDQTAYESLRALTQKYLLALKRPILLKLAAPRTAAK